MRTTSPLHEKFPINHLKSREIRYIISNKSLNVDQIVMVEVSYTSHCYTKSIKDGSVYSPESLVDDGQNKRIICPDRHWCSFELNNIMDNLASAKIYESKDKYVTYAEVLNFRGSICSYEVYFYVKKRGSVIYLEVVSAYSRDKAHEGNATKRRSGSRINLGTLLRKA